MELPVNELSKRIKKAEDVIVTKLRDKRFSEEEDISARLAERIECEIESDYKDIKVKATTFKRKGIHSEEKTLGADLMVVLEINKKDENLQKSFLVQAKKGEIVSSHIKLAHDKKLIVQCNKMLTITSDSFVWIYTESGIFVVPAYGIKNRNPNRKSLSSFFKEFFSCFVGDHKLTENLNQIIPEKLHYYANNILYLKINLAPHRKKIYYSPPPNS